MLFLSSSHSRSALNLERLNWKFGVVRNSCVRRIVKAALIEGRAIEISHVGESHVPEAGKVEKSSAVEFGNLAESGAFEFS